MEQTFFKTYGMGWMVEDYRHEVMLNHGGNTPGMTTAMGFMPDKKIGVVVLSNMDHTVQQFIDSSTDAVHQV